MALTTRASRFVILATVSGILMLVSGPPAFAKRNTLPHTDAVTGFWYTQEREGGIELYSCGDKKEAQVCGRFFWLKQAPGEGISRDTENPDPSRRNRPLCQLQFMGGFTPDGEGRYTDGWIYSPQHGQIFNAEMKLVDHDTLDLHGYVLIPLLGETQTWKRANVMPSCKTGQFADSR